MSESGGSAADPGAPTPGPGGPAPAPARSIRRQLLESFLLVIALLGLVAALYSYNTRVSLATYHGEQQRFLFLNDLSRAAREASVSLWSLATQRDQEEAARREYLVQREALRRQSAALPQNLSDLDNALPALNLQRQIATFLEEGDRVLDAVSARDVAGYSQHYQEAAAVAAYVDEGARQILDRELTAYGATYQRLTDWTERVQRLGLALLALSAGFALAFAWWLARTLSLPIQRLVRSAQRLAAGSFDAGEAIAEGPAELLMLARAFDGMRSNLRDLVQEVRRRADVERQMQEVTLKNLEMAHLLKEAELRTLQAQIHPHFLFNTLNLVSRTAMLEGADQTSELIASVADLLRYNLRPLDARVSLGEEVAAVQEYFAIQKARFRDRVELLLEADEAALDQPVPGLTLQPLVENAFIHGIEGCEGGGRIEVRVTREPEEVIVTVTDNGRGMEPERVEALLAAEPVVSASSRGHTTGLGFLNVRRRLELFYERPGLVAVDSAPGRGTMVQLRLPRAAREVAASVQTADRR
ncbi:MAG: histidine kinase [Firmicutes bacterium]|nr:histidine kinase [Bacillota bacterium]